MPAKTRWSVLPGQRLPEATGASRQETHLNTSSHICLYIAGGGLHLVYVTGVYSRRINGLELISVKKSHGKSPRFSFSHKAFDCFLFPVRPPMCSTANNPNKFLEKAYTLCRARRSEFMPGGLHPYACTKLIG